MHRAHVELTVRAAAEAEANLLIHPVVGETNPGDVDYFVRVRCYQAVLKHYPEQTTALSLLPLAMRMGGPREAVWHAIIRKNYGCSHLVVGRDHAGPRNAATGESFYGPYDAQDLLKQHGGELGIRMVPFQEMVYVEDRAQYLPATDVPEGAKVLRLSGTELRRRLREGLAVPAWFSYPEVMQELRRSYPPRSGQGFTVFFTGLSGSGKSTVANVLVAKLMEMGDRPVTLLDGDIVRKNLSSELGFSKEHRDLNILRIGFVASEITKNRGIAICAPIAPYAAIRRQNREVIGQYGGYIEVHISTPLEVCEQRDRKGLYAKARAGLIKGFTGIDDPYEAPEDAEVVIDTAAASADEAAHRILLHLEKQGYIALAR
jgi:sulfate adenylyltransferase